MIEISIAEARRRLPELMRLSETGERIVITRRGKPVSQLVRLGDASPTRKLDIEAIRQDLAGLPLGRDSLPSLQKIRRDAR